MQQPPLNFWNKEFLLSFQILPLTQLGNKAYLKQKKPKATGASAPTSSNLY